MFLSRSEPRTSGLRAIAGLALDFALLRDELAEPREGAADTHPHRRALRPRRRHRGGEVVPRPQVCVCAHTQAGCPR